MEILNSLSKNDFILQKTYLIILLDTQTQLTNRTLNAPLLRYVDSVRTHGHRAAQIDPLDLLERKEVAALDPSRYGLTDPSACYDINGIIWTSPVGTDSGPTKWELKDITRHLREIYVGRIAYEYMHSPSKTERLWFSHLLESQEKPAELASTGIAGRDPPWKKFMWLLLRKSEIFDQFLQTKFPNLKRYGLEGGESMIPALHALFEAAAAAKLDHIVLAMPHRGRLNLLVSLLDYVPRALFHKIKGGSEIPEELLEMGASGDVVSHLCA